MPDASAALAPPLPPNRLFKLLAIHCRRHSATIQSHVPPRLRRFSSQKMSHSLTTPFSVLSFLSHTHHLSRPETLPDSFRHHVGSTVFPLTNNNLSPLAAIDVTRVFLFYRASNQSKPIKTKHTIFLVFFIRTTIKLFSSQCFAHVNFDLTPKNAKEKTARILLDVFSGFD